MLRGWIHGSPPVRSTSGAANTSAARLEALPPTHAGSLALGGQRLLAHAARPAPRKAPRETILTGRVTSRSTASARTAARQESSGWRDRLERRFSLGRQLSNGQAAKRLEGSGVVLEPPNRAGVTERSDSAEHILVAIRGHSRSSEERLDAPG